MIEGIYQIGSIVKQGKRISEIASDIPQLKEDIKYKVGVINFSLDKEIIEIDTRKEYELGDEDKFKYIKLGLTGRQNQSKLLHNMSDLLSSFGAGTEQACHQEKEKTSNIVAQYPEQTQVIQ